MHTNRLFSYLPRLLSTIKSRNTRDSLILIIESIRDRLVSLSIERQYLDAIIMLNAWDRRFIDQADYEQRHSAYAQIEHIFQRDQDRQDDQLLSSLLSMLVHTNAFTLVEVSCCCC
jgi:hypothetical protein